MKSGQQIQAAVDEIRAVCKKHGVILLGTCRTEGIYGEISVGGSSGDDIGWSNPISQLTNIVVDQYGDGVRTVEGIGDIDC